MDSATPADIELTPDGAHDHFPAFHREAPTHSSTNDGPGVSGAFVYPNRKGRMTFLTQYADAIEARRVKLRKRGFALAAETIHPTGQAALWYADAVACVPRSGQAVARQIARLCGDDSEVTIPWRSLADAVGMRDRAGNLRRYTERGAKTLADAGWLEVETVGSKRGAKTTFRLLPGDRSSACLGWIDDQEWFAKAA